MTAAEAKAINGRRLLGNFTRNLASVGHQGRLEGA
jgi:hypothetical protein